MKSKLLKMIGDALFIALVVHCIASSAYLLGNFPSSMLKGQRLSGLLSRDSSIIEKTSTPQFHFSSIVRRQMSGKVNEEESSKADIDTADMPDKPKFNQYFKSCLAVKEKEMSLEQFMLYEEVAALLKDELVLEEDIRQLWNSIVGDSKKLQRDDAYELLCMISDLPNAEDAQYFEEEFARLTENTAGLLSYADLMAWDDMKELKSENLLTENEIDSIWTDIVGEKTGKMNAEQFLELNMAIDGILGDNYEEEDEDDDASAEGVEMEGGDGGHIAVDEPAAQQ